MNMWQEQIIEKFPEFGQTPSSWTLIDAAAEIGPLLDKAARAHDKPMCKRILELVIWADQQTQQDESFIYFCQDILRSPMLNPATRKAIAPVLNNRSLSQIRGYVEYVASKEVFAQLSQEVRFAHQKG